MRKKTFLFVLAAMSLVLAGTAVAFAHEIVIKPGTAAAEAGKALPFGVHSAHVFIVSEELETPADVKAFAWENGKGQEIALKADQKAFTFDGVATFAKPGMGIIRVHRLPQVWTLTPEGMKKGTKKELPGGTKSNLYEKFAKALVPVSGSTAGFDAVVGDRLELVPLTDPAKVATGQDMDVQVLLDGKPTPAVVLATYDGFTDTPNSYAYYTETNDSGVAKVRISHPGLWLVRTEIKTASTNAAADQDTLRATLSFFVK